MSKREKVLLIILGVVFVLSGGYYAYAYKGALFASKKVVNTNININANSNVNINSNDNLNNNTNTSVVVPILDPGVNWITPVKIDSLGLFKKSDSFDCDIDSMEYYKTANLDNGGEIILIKASCGMGGSYAIRFRKDSAGVYNYLYKMNKDGIDIPNLEGILDGFGSKTKVDYETVYASISAPAALTTSKNITLKKVSNGLRGLLLFSEISNYEKIDESAYGSIYRSLSDKTKEITERDIILKLADSTTVVYGVSIPFMLDDNVPDITFDGAEKNKDSFLKSLVMSCGYHSASSVVANPTAIVSRIIASGSTKNGEKIYTMKSNDDAIATSAYEFYKVGRDSNVIPRTEFFNKKPLFLWQDSYGDYITFINSNYGPLAECGKPVVYLYPEKTTKVSVSVGASITKSEPAYANGWKVLAQPSGKLLVNGKTYDSLYWEGKGEGIYPEINSGFIVPGKEIEKTLIDHLTRLGLNEKERNDFIEFWLPKMPNTPFVRLTWFGTKEMDALAPLKVTPKPDTSIRIFLDYEGLQEPVDIRKQRLSTIPRKGFTLVEWGGLLKGNLK